jgi:hypothetical protein
LANINRVVPNVTSTSSGRSSYYSLPHPYGESPWAVDAHTTRKRWPCAQGEEQEEQNKYETCAGYFTTKHGSESREIGACTSFWQVIEFSSTSSGQQYHQPAKECTLRRW